MNSFLFLANSADFYVPNSNFDVVTLKPCVNQSADAFKQVNPELWDVIKDLPSGHGNIGTEYDVYSLKIKESLKMVSNEDWCGLKPCMFTTIFVDTDNAVEVWKLEENWREARRQSKGNRMSGFCVHPAWRYWI